MAVSGSVFLRWKQRLIWLFFFVVVHACGDTEESIGKTTYFIQNFPWHYLNSGPTQKKWNSTIFRRVKHWSRNSRLIRPKTGTAMANRTKWRSSFCLIFFIFSWPYIIQGKIIVRSVFHGLSYDITHVSIRFSTPKIIPFQRAMYCAVIFTLQRRNR